MYQSSTLAGRIELNQVEGFPNLKAQLDRAPTTGEGGGDCGSSETGSAIRSERILYNNPQRGIERR